MGLSGKISLDWSMLSTQGSSGYPRWDEVLGLGPGCTSTTESLGKMPGDSSLNLSSETCGPQAGGEGNGTPLQYSCLENPWREEPGRL